MLCVFCVLESNSSSSDDGQKDTEGITLAQVVAGLTMLCVCYFFAQSEQARGMPEVYFLQHMLYTGEVWWCI